MPLAHHVLKPIPDDAPTQIVQRTRRRDRARTAKDDGRNDVAQPCFCVRIPLLRTTEEQPNNQGHDGSQDEKQEQRRVDLARGEHPGGTDEAPDDACGKKDATARAGEVLRLGRGADFGDSAEGVVEY